MEMACRDPMRRDPMRRDPMRRDPMRRDPMRRDPMRRDPMRIGIVCRFDLNGFGSDPQELSRHLPR
jgi:hypothetical protein